MKVVVFTLGCKVNKYESDSMMYALKLKGYEVSDSLESADIYIINTCAVTSEAEKKSRQAIARCRKLNANAKIIVCGCASQREPLQFKDKDVSYISGVAYKMKLIDKFKNRGQHIGKLPLVYEDNMVALENRTRAYIKVQDGCNNFCSYCIIPYLRGRSRSRNIVSILNEVGALSKENIKEIVLTGIDLSDFKVDDEPALIVLLEKLDDFGFRMRLGSLEERVITDDFLLRLSRLKNFCPQFHLSLQSGSDSVLKRMNRHYTSKEYLEKVNMIYSVFPNASITTDVIVGFPDETEEEFLETLDFVKQCAFFMVHIFPYSKRTGTVASRYKDLPKEIKDERVKRLNKECLRLKKIFLKNHKNGSVLIEEKEDGFYVGHTENFIKCYIKSKEDITNQIIDVKFSMRFRDGIKARRQ